MNDPSLPEDELFDAARRITNAAERRAYLDALSQVNPVAAAKLDHLLRAEAQADEFFRQSGPALQNIRLERSAPEAPGDYIERYKLLAKIGEGGCGVVYMAEQETPIRRRVALKIIRLGMDTRSVVARFEAERQALSLMDHSNIARVFDAGATETGRPFFVMELVRGTNITSYCDDHRLSIRERLQLFVQVCYGVQHAHQKSVIHRDLKPSNILVCTKDGVPVPKVIDFGIAKAIQGRLTDKTIFTEYQQFLGTPAYVSPEQALMATVDVDTRSDIYSLGVVLYELLAGKTPFDPQALLAEGLDALRRTIREIEPQPPSTRLRAMASDELARTAERRSCGPVELRKLLGGDLDWVVMKCLEKDPSRRYQTAQELALDVSRYLDHQPIVARAPSRLYRFKKFCRRNRWAILGSTALAAALLIATIVSTTEAARARRADSALREELANSFLAQAQAGRWSGRVGRRFGGLELIQKAASIRPSLELRNEAIACMALSDLRPVPNWGAWNAGGEGKFFDANLERAAYQDNAGTIHLCRASDGQELSQFPGFALPLHSCMFSRNGAFITVHCGASHEQLATIDLSTHAVIFNQEQPGMSVFDLSEDDRWVAISYDQPQANYPVVVYERSSGKVQGSFAAGRAPVELRFDPVDPKRLLLSDSSATVRLFDWTSAQVLREFKHPDQVKATTWNPAGEIIATACADNNVRLWNVNSGAELAVLRGHDWAVIFVSFNPGGNLLLSRAWGGKIHVWDSYSKAALLNTSVFAVTTPFSRSKNQFATLEDDHTWKLWEVSESLGYQHLNGEVAGVETTGSCVFSADSRWLLSTGDKSVRLWDTLTGRTVAALPGSFTDYFAMSGGTNLYVCGNDRIYTVGTSPESASPTFKLVTTNAASLEKTPFELPADESHFAGRTQGLFYLSKRPNRREPIRLAGSAHRRFAELSPDNTLAATWSDISTNTQIWNLETGERVRSFATTGGGAWTTFSPNGNVLVAAEISHYRCWTVGDWKKLWEIPRSATGYFGHMAFSPDGKIVALAISRSVVLLVNAQTGQELARLESPEGTSTTWTAFSPDGSKLAMTGIGQIQLWDLSRIRSELAALHLDW